MNSLKKFLKKVRRLLLSGFIIKDFFVFKKQDHSSRFSLKVNDFYPCILDKTFETGFDRHYTYHTSWAARKVAEIKPSVHTDIASSLYFSTIVSAFVPVEFYDLRPADITLSGWSGHRANLLTLPFQDGSVNSLSCMHTIEHVGLGRYGDAIDPEGDLKAIRELKRVLASEGSLLFVVPVGKPKIMFNAHRIYSYEQIMDYFSDLKLQEFTLIPEKSGAPILNASVEQVADEEYACGCFWFIKS